MGVLVCAAGCRPDIEEPAEAEWILGWFSTASSEDELHVDAMANLEFREDGTGTLQSVGGCGALDWGTTPLEWETTGQDSVLARIPEAEKTPETAHLNGWIYRRLPECGRFEYVEVWDAGRESDPLPLYEGRLCMSAGPDVEGCIGSNCNTCYKSWCEGDEPPECDEGS